MEIFRLFGSIFVNDGATSALGEVERRANAADFSISGLGEKMNKFGESVTKLGENLTKKLTIPLAAAAVGMVKLAEKASDLVEANNVVENTFKSSAKSIEDWTNTTDNSAGISKLASTQWVGFMGALLKSSGVAEDSAADMSKNLVQLTGDMSSFYNIGTSDMWEKIRSGISGETMPLKQLGINMSVANLEVYAMSEGIKKAYKDMSETEKTTLRYNYLLSVTKDAQGDFGRTLNDSFANQARVAKLNLDTLAGTLGTKFLPFVMQSTKELNNFMVALNNAIKGGNESSKLGKTINEIANALGKLKTEDVKKIVEIGAALAGVGPSLMVFGKITQSVGKFQTALGFGTKGVIDFTSSSVTGFKNIGLKISSFMGSSARIPTFFRTLSTNVRLGFGFMTSTVGGKFAALGNIIKTSPIGTLASGLFGKIPIGLKVAFDKMGKTITQTLPGLIPKIAEPLQKIGGTVFTGLTKIVGLGLKMIAPAALIALLLVGLGLAYEKMGPQIDAVIGKITTKGPEMITKFCDKLVKNIPYLVLTGTTLLMKLINALTANAPALITGAVAIITTLVNSLTANIPRLIPVILTLIQTILTAVLNNLPQIILAGLKLLLALAEGISNNMTQIVNTIVTVVIEIIQILIQNLPLIIEIGIKILVALIEGLSKAIPQLIAALPQIVSAIWNGLKEINWSELGKNIIDGIIEGLKAAGNGMLNTLKNLAGDALKGAKEVLGIHSPSKKFRDEVGKFIPEGISAGIDENGDVVNDSLKNLSQNMKFSSDLKATLNSNANIGKNSFISVDNSKNKTNNKDQADSNNDLKSLLKAITDLVEVIKNNPVILNLNGEILAKTLSPYADKVSGTNMLLTDRGVRV